MTIIYTSLANTASGIVALSDKSDHFTISLLYDGYPIAFSMTTLSTYVPS